MKGLNSPHKSPPGFRFKVPAYSKAPRRAEERERKRAMKAGLVGGRRAPKSIDWAAGRGEQDGHRPNCKLRGKGTNHRNHIWPEGKVAKPGRMG